MTPTDAQRRLQRERDAQAALMATKRAAGRNLTIASVTNPRRRRRCERDDCLWLRTYLPLWFSNPFTRYQRGMVEAFRARATYGGWKALAEDRGGGKTTIAKGCLLRSIVTGEIHFAGAVAATARLAQAFRQDVCDTFDRQEYATFQGDYPEVCVPIKALAGAPARGGAQTVNGERTFLRWGAGEMVIEFPTISGSPSSGALFGCAGLNSAVRGLVFHGQRPDFLVLDDPETEESAASELQTEQREHLIEATLVGLAPPDRRIGILYPCTIWSSISLAATFTDPRKKPAWDGERHRLLATLPKHMDLWERYQTLRQAGVLEGDRDGRAAHAFYLANRVAMDAGADVTNPYRFDGRRLADGSQYEVSALEFCFNAISDVGWTAFATEHQNEPPETQNAEVLSVDVPLVMKRTNGRIRGTVSPEADYVTAGVDIGARAVHWLVMDWRRAAGGVVDYGVIPVHSPLEGPVEAPEQVDAVQQAIFRALLEFHDMAAGGWGVGDSAAETRGLDLALIDVGYARSSMDEPVWTLMAESAGRTYQAAKGFGSGSGQARFSPPPRPGRGRRVFNHAFGTYQTRRHAWLYNVDADYWKLFVHQGLTTPPDRPGAVTLFGSDPMEHRNLARHLTAERWEARHKPGRGTLWTWRTIRKANHWFDCAAYAAAAAGILGVQVVGRDPAATTTAARKEADHTTTRERRGRRVGRVARLAP